MRIFFQALFLRSIILAIMFAPLALQAAPKSPAEMFGFNPGDDYKLASYEQMEAYYRQLAAESDRVELREIGESSLGRPLLLLTISSPENLANQDRYKSISEQLARARVDSETADQLALEGKAVVWIDGGLHATEVAHAQMTSSLAHRVATEESNEMQLIRENVIFLLMPVMNPDGLDVNQHSPLLDNNLSGLLNGPPDDGMSENITPQNDELSYLMNQDSTKDRNNYIVHIIGANKYLKKEMQSA